MSDQPAEWKTSSFCSANSCIQARSMPGERVEMRQVKDGVTYAWWVLERAEFDAFRAGMKAGEFDDI